MPREAFSPRLRRSLWDAGIPNFVQARAESRESMGSTSAWDSVRLSQASAASSFSPDASWYWFAVVQQISMEPAGPGDTEATAGTPQPTLYGLAKPDAFADLQMGQLLGAGSFGRVYRGTWHGTPVAVKARGQHQSGICSFMAPHLMGSCLCRSWSAPRRTASRGRCWRRWSART